MTIQPISSSASYTADRSWLAGMHGTDSTETITCDITKFTKDVHYQASTDSTQPYSRLLSGVPVGRVTASGLFGPYDPAAADGRQVLAGLIFAETLFAPTQTKVAAALLWHGTVRTAKVPGGLDPSKIVPSAAAAQIRFV